MRLPLLLPGVYLDSVEPHPPSLRAEPSQPEEAELGFWLVRPGGGLEGAATDSALGGRGTFHSSWAREELDTEPPPGDHFDSLGLAAGREERSVNSVTLDIQHLNLARRRRLKRNSYLKCFVLYW